MKSLKRFLLVAFLLLMTQMTNAALITFDDAIAGATTFSFDGDGDLIDDVIFSTTDPLGFNTVGPGPNQLYIDEPGLEGTTTIAPDLRVDFLNGASGALQFGFAMSTGTPLTDGVTFDIYDAADMLLGSGTVLGDIFDLGGGNSSVFVEGLVNVAFAGVASYATFDFSTVNASRYIIDNFEGTFGSTEPIGVSEPPMLALIAFGLMGIGFFRKRKLR